MKQRRYTAQDWTDTYAATVREGGRLATKLAHRLVDVATEGGSPMADDYALRLEDQLQTLAGNLRSMGEVIGIDANEADGVVAGWMETVQAGRSGVERLNGLRHPKPAELEPPTDWPGKVREMPPELQRIVNDHAMQLVLRRKRFGW